MSCSSSFQSTKLNNILHRTKEICRVLTKKQGVHSVIAMESAGFRYTDNADTVHCDMCELEVSGWTLNMKPFAIHAQRSPTCPFVTNRCPVKPTIITAVSSLELSSVDERPSKRQKIGVSQESFRCNIFTEVRILEQIRHRTFSHWPYQTHPSGSQMIEAGFFHCNVSDRVLCIYCNIICQQWTSRTDDPWTVHKTLSSQCPYVIAKTKLQQTTSLRNVNEQITRDKAVVGIDDDLFRHRKIVADAPRHIAYASIENRHASFVPWAYENLPPIDDLVRAGFFYTGTKTIVTCFYCNGSLQNWGANDNPKIEHARWFPHCAYAKQLCGAELYRKIQESKRAQQERAKGNDANDRAGNAERGSSRGQLMIPDESTLSRYVAARLDLPISQQLLNQNYKLSVIKRCWEDQLRLKHDDFVHPVDLLMACMVLQKQIEHIDGKTDNIIIPRVRMNMIRAGVQSDEYSRPAFLEEYANNVDVETSTESQYSQDEINTLIQNNYLLSSSLCTVCLEREKSLACKPCDHLVSCTSCGHSLRSCPICLSNIQSFVPMNV